MGFHFLIIGQGLAGTTLAWQLHARGVPFLVVDRDEPSTSSKVAAGLVTPITGLRLNLSWRYPELYAEARAFYQKCATSTGEADFFHETPIVRLFADNTAVERWKKRQGQASLQPFVASPCPQPLVAEDCFHNPLGGFQQQHSGWLDTVAFLEASRRFFQGLGCWQAGSVQMESLATDADFVMWHEQRFSHVVFCTGWEAAGHPWFDWVPFQSARGTVLELQADLKGETRIISSNGWVLPRANGTLRAGSTYELHHSGAVETSTEALDDLQDRLRKLVRPAFQVTGMQTGVRPIIQRRKALLGLHPLRARVGFFNGLGSKGVLRAPWLSRHLTEHLLDGVPLESELDVAGNF